MFFLLFIIVPSLAMIFTGYIFEIYYNIREDKQYKQIRKMLKERGDNKCKVQK